MGFEVEYQSLGGAPNNSSRYVWVIKPPQGPSWEAPIHISKQGRLRRFVPQWGPTAGTYETHIDEVTRQGRRTVSRKLTLHYSYP